MVRVEAWEAETVAVVRVEVLEEDTGSSGEGGDLGGRER